MIAVDGAHGGGNTTAAAAAIEAPAGTLLLRQMFPLLCVLRRLRLLQPSPTGDC